MQLAAVVAEEDHKVLIKTVEPVEPVVLADTLNQFLVEQLTPLLLEAEALEDHLVMAQVHLVEVLEHLFRSLILEQ
jgi:hypothetical protein|tara:strand:- start:197 stop:424 length:228 start_codon:yes stop_codon:yes gene_type:complete